MTTIDLAVVTSWPRERIDTGDFAINHTIRIHLPHVPAYTTSGSNTSIASYLLHPAAKYVLFWEPDRRMYGKIHLERHISLLSASSMRSHIQSNGPLLLLTQGSGHPSPPNLQRHVVDDPQYLQSDDVHLLPSSHIGDTPPRPSLLQRIRNAAPAYADDHRPPRTPMSSPNLLWSDPADHHLASLASEGADVFDAGDEMLLMYEDETETQDVPVPITQDAGIYVTSGAKTTTWTIALHRPDKETVFCQFFEQFCGHFDLSGGVLPISASCIKIHMTYVGETGFGDGLVVEMLSYIWKHLIEETHHFVRANAGGDTANGYYIPSDHPDTCLFMGHLGIFTAVSLAYSVCPHDLHPMFLRRIDKPEDHKKDALLYDPGNCVFIPSTYEEFDDDREQLAEWWNDEHDFDRRVMPLERVKSEVVYEQLIKPEMYKSLVFPTTLGKRNLDTLRYFLFEYAEREMNGVSVAMVEDAVVKVNYEHANSSDLIAMFHLSPADQLDTSAATSLTTFSTILSGYSVTRIKQLMVSVTNKAYPTPIMVRFGYDKNYISTCLSILQLKHSDEKGMVEDLETILAHDLPNMPYHEQD